MRSVRTVLLGLVLAATGVYFVLYLYGWEWYRAFVVGIVFLAAEIAVVGVHLTTVVRKAASAPAPPPAPGDPEGARVVADVLGATPRQYPDTFRWLQPRDGRTAVFIPLLLGAGVLMSGVAWAMERVAGAVYGGRIDASLARTAAPLVPPDDLLDTPTSEALLALPGRWADPGVGRGRT